MIEMVLIALLSIAVGLLTGYGLAVRQAEKREEQRQFKERLK